MGRPTPLETGQAASAALGVRLSHLPLIQEPGMTKNDVFNRGFRDGANARAREGLPLEGPRFLPAAVPDPPRPHAIQPDRGIWAQGFILGYRIGASDRELERRGRGRRV